MSSKKKFIPVLEIPVEKEKIKIKPVLIRPLTQGQDYLLKAINECQIVACSGPAGSGKALSLDSKIYTPDGYILNKDIKVGDIVKTPNNKTASVTAVYPQPIKKMYKISFKDGTFVKCCEEHLWKVKNRSAGKDNHKKERVVDTKYIIKNFKNKDGSFNLSIKSCKPVQFNKKKYFIHPYIMGILLSEGCITVRVGFSSCEKEIVDNVNLFLNKKYILKQTKNKVDYYIKNTIGKRRQNLYKEDLRKLGLLGLKSYEKFIPEEYLYGSITQRQFLLQGLMDGDGSVSKNGSSIYYTTSEQLKDSVIELVSSLGGSATVSTKIPHFIYKNEKKAGRLCYILHIALPNNIKPFALPRKALLVKDKTKYKSNRLIRNVEYIGEDYSQCISIDSPEKMYLTNNFIPTHNTYLSLGQGFKDLKAGKYEKLILIRPLEECGKSVGFLPGSLDEKIGPHIKAFTELYNNFTEKEELIELIKTEKLVIETLEFLRGRTLHKSFIVVDEAQNCEYSQLKMVLTRIGKHSKMVICGDLQQTDLDERFWKNGEIPLDYVMDRLYELDVPNIAIVELTEDDIVRHGIIKLICKALL